MVRFDTEWRTSWNGHTILVRNWWDLFLITGEELIVDGAIVVRQTGWLRTSASLTVFIDLDGIPAEIRADIGPIDLGMRIGCRIFVNDELIGGDVSARFWQ